jgi:hypothetical protein
MAGFLQKIQIYQQKCCILSTKVDKFTLIMDLSPKYDGREIFDFHHISLNP